MILIGDQNLPRIIYDKLVRQTDKAVQYEIDGKLFWIPDSQIIGREDLGNHVVELPMWLIESKGLEVYIIDDYHNHSR